MIAQVDEALCRLLGPRLPAGTQIRLDPPKPTWQTETRGRSVELFLFALRNAGARVPPTGGRDAGAPSTGVTQSRRCTLSYLVTARAGQVRDEHALLDAALHAMTAADEIPQTYLPNHSDGCLPVEIALADVDPTALWTTLGMPVRAGFVVSVTAGLSAPKPTRKRRAFKASA